MKGLGLKILLAIMIKVFVCFPQNEANLWHFGKLAGFDFSNGQPELILNPMPPTPGSTSTMCDTNGNLLFTTNGEAIWNRNNQIMLNGNDLEGTSKTSQGVLIVKKPGINQLYYVFTTSNSDNFPESTPGLYYSIVDMALDNGLGGVTMEKNILLADAWDAAEKIVACRKENSKDIWVITRKFVEDGYAAFLLTPQGINPTAVFSQTYDKPNNDMWGNMKISPNKKHLVAAYSYDFSGNEEPEYEVCNFNSLTGEIDVLYTIRHGTPFHYGEPTGVEFSPDSKYLYLSLLDEGSDNRVKFFQYDMQFYQDSLQFVQSKIHIATGPCYGLQLARDGKIYLTNEGHSPLYKVSVINKPWKHGTDCEYVEGAIDLGGANVYNFLPNILLDYLYRFEWEGRCQSEPFVFQSNFIPEPAFIEWKFNDLLSGSNISHDINPVHTFSSAGEYEVHVHVEYPNGRIEETSRVVTVGYSPKPDLGEDIFTCENQEIVLNAGDEEGFYSWSNGVLGENHNEITVSDTGWNWVQVNNDGCMGYDTIHVGLFPKPVLDETNLSLIPTSCGASNGKILGLAVSGEEPLSFEWFDADGNLVGTETDLFNLPVGNYFLHTLDGHGCETVSGAYTIEDAGDIEISLIEKQDTYCSQNTGSINITAVSGGPANLLFSINNGNSWQSGNPVFENLPSGNYFIRVKDQSGCESVYENNPVLVENIPGPEVTSVTTSPEIDYLQNGQIDISATANSGQLYFSIDGGTSFQTGNGLFSNLSAGTYFCKVKDDFGCDTVFTVVLNRTISQLIEAIAGDGYTCIGNAAVVPLKLNNFSGILKFNLKLTYDTAILTCDGYINIHPELEENLVASIIPGTDEVVINWQGDSTLSLKENATMLKLVFGAKDEGFSTIDWAALPGESVFYDGQLDEVNADYHVGSLRIYTRPEIFIPNNRRVCEGEFLLMVPFVEGGTGDVSHFWEGPNGFESTGSFVEFEQITKPDAGNYVITVTDTIDCVESAEVIVTVYDNPQINFPPQDTIFANPGFILEAGSGYERYLWNTAETSESISINQEGEYWVEVISAQQCQSADTVTILWGGEPFYLPNAFTPDGNGLNDEFKPVEKYDFVKNYQFSIFNRWGQLIFETSDFAHGWDGTYQGKPVPGGTYVYRIVFTAYPNFSKRQVVTGGVVVVR